MFERLFSHHAVRRRHAERPSADLLQSYAYSLLDSGYCPVVVARQLCSWERFLVWLNAERRVLDDADETCVERFMVAAADGRRWHGRPTRPAASMAWHRPATANLLRLVRAGRADNGVLRPEPSAWYADGLLDFRRFLRDHRHLSTRVIDFYAKEAAALLCSLPVASWSALTTQLNARVIDDYLLRRTAGRSGALARAVTGALRSVLRYWFLVDVLADDLAVKLYTPRRYRLASLPRGVPWPEVERMLAAVDRTTATGRRDYAILLIIATYGWRASEVAALTLDDICWRRQTVCIRHAKGGQPAEFPLVSSVAHALIEYLRDGRPVTVEHREVFLRVRAPLCPLQRSGAIYNVTRKHFLRAGLQPLHFGPHTLRHSRAAALLMQGESLKTIGDLLGHRDPESTQIYTKVDVNALRQVSDVVGEVRR